jgi:hypothetical protein
LDTLSQTLNVECCWIQTIGDRNNQQLSLAAERGFSDDMRSEIISMNMTNDFSGQVIGMGHKIIIPDLNNDGLYGLNSFRKAGYKWLVAVPLMTYRVYGILGTASHDRKILQKETADLFMVIAGLIANALVKVDLSRSIPPQKKSADLPGIKSQTAAPPPEKPKQVIQESPVASSLLEIPRRVVPKSPIATPTLEKPKPVIPEYPIVTAPSLETIKKVIPKSPAATPPLEKPKQVILKSAVATPQPEKPKQVIPDTAVTTPPRQNVPPKPVDKAFHSHTHKMRSFRQSHH